MVIGSVFFLFTNITFVFAILTFNPVFWANKKIFVFSCNCLQVVDILVNSSSKTRYSNYLNIVHCTFHF